MVKFEYQGRQFNIKSISSTDCIIKKISSQRNFYEIDLLEYISVFFKPNHSKKSVFLDVGANIGNHSIFFGSFLCDLVLSIEPYSKVQDILLSNLQENIDNFKIFNVALGSRNSYGLAINSIPAMNVGSTKITSINVDKNNEEAVRIVTLDSLLKNECCLDMDETISLIKIDVEGMELDVVKGASETIKKYKPHILAESADKESHRNLSKYLKKFGYVSISKWAFTPVYHYVYKPSYHYRIFLKIRTIPLKFKWFFLYQKSRLKTLWNMLFSKAGS